MGTGGVRWSHLPWGRETVPPRDTSRSASSRLGNARHTSLHLTTTGAGGSASWAALTRGLRLTHGGRKPRVQCDLLLFEPLSSSGQLSHKRGRPSEVQVVRPVAQLRMRRQELGPPGQAPATPAPAGARGGAGRSAPCSDRGRRSVPPALVRARPGAGEPWLCSTPGRTPASTGPASACRATRRGSPRAALPGLGPPGGGRREGRSVTPTSSRPPSVIAVGVGFGRNRPTSRVAQTSRSLTKRSNRVNPCRRGHR
jgi:hypothetical protein